MAIKKRRQGLTLIELLVVIAVIAVLAALAFPGYRIAIDHAHCSTCASNMHGLSLAFMSYAFDNDGLLPSRVVTGDKWPTLLMPYVGNNPNIYVDPGDPVARQIPVNQLVSNTANNSSFIFNGFNDLGAHENPNLTVNLYTIISLSNLILLGQQVPAAIISIWMSMTATRPACSKSRPILADPITLSPMGACAT